MTSEILQRLLHLLGYLRAGLAQVGHQSPQFFRIFREFLGTEENKGQEQQEHQLLKGDEQGRPPKFKPSGGGRNGDRRRNPRKGLYGTGGRWLSEGRP